MSLLHYIISLGLITFVWIAFRNRGRTEDKCRPWVDYLQNEVENTWIWENEKYQWTRSQK